MDDFRLTAKQITRLKTLHRTLRDRKPANRVKVVVLLCSTWSVADVAQVLLVDETTIRNWLEKYQQGGQEKELKSNCGRERVNINGAVDIDTLETVTNFADSINSQSTMRLFDKLEAKHPDAKKIHVIVDNATYYKSQMVKVYLKHSR